MSESIKRICFVQNSGLAQLSATTRSRIVHELFLLQVLQSVIAFTSTVCRREVVGIWRSSTPPYNSLRPPISRFLAKSDGVYAFRKQLAGYGGRVRRKELFFTERDLYRNKNRSAEWNAVLCSHWERRVVLRVARSFDSRSFAARD